MWPRAGYECTTKTIGRGQMAADELMRVVRTGGGVATGSCGCHQRCPQHRTEVDD